MSEAFLTSDSQLWATPWLFMASMADEWTFTLDVCAMDTSRKAPRFYTEAQDAFKQDWARDAAGGDAFCNPPYSEYLGKNVGDWAQECWRWRGALNSCMLLPINKMDQDWFHDLVVPAGVMSPVRGRIAFVDPVTGLIPRKWAQDKKTKKWGWVSAGNSQGSMLIKFGPRYAPGPMVTHPWRTFREAHREKTAQQKLSVDNP